MTATRTMDVERGTPVTTPTIEWLGRTTSWSDVRTGRQPHLGEAPTVFVAHDDMSLRRALEQVIRSVGWEVGTFTPELSRSVRSGLPIPSCLVIDAEMSEIDGLELQRRAAVDWPDTPVVFVSRAADVATTVKAMKAGAVDFLVEPYRERDLVEAISEALKLSQAACDRRRHTDALRQRHASLSVREREVMALVVVGRLNKQVGAELGISEITVKAHRGNAMRKMKAHSLPDLVTMAAALRAAAA